MNQLHLSAQIARARRWRSRNSFQQLTEKQLHFFSRIGQRLSPGRSSPVNSAASSTQSHFLGTQKSARFQAMEHRIKRASAHFVSVPLQFLDHAQAKDWFFARMVENVDANQP
jgi:hypothetical protein